MNKYLYKTMWFDKMKCVVEVQRRELLAARLQERSSPTEMAALRLRASAWCAANGYLDEALYHALAAHDWAAAVQVGTANFRNPNACVEIIDGIRAFLLRERLARLDEYRGTLEI